MAAAEARAAWQRAGNRCFVQEDAKRAPKLACCQSSTSSSKHIDAGLADIPDGPNHPTVGFMPINRTPSCSNLPPDAKWWLQMQPKHGNQRSLNFEQCNAKTTNLETSPPVTMNPDGQVEEIGEMSEESLHGIVYDELDSFLDVKKHPESKLEELNLLDGKVDQDFVDLKNMTEYYELLEMEMLGGSVSKHTNDFSSSAASSWVGGEKVPWWRVIDGEELASYVAQKSLHCIENCDLPPPQKTHVRKEQYKQDGSIAHDEIFMSSLDWEAQSDAIFSPSFGGSLTKTWSSVKERQSQNESPANEPVRTNSIDTPDPSKAKLLEALCHSQTRAREAERAAKQAYTNKEHILTLFFKQAAQLFAYKQWFKLLQVEMETLLLQTNDSDSSDSSPLMTALPDLLPWMPLKPRKACKTWQKSAKSKRHKRGSLGNDVGKYAVAFAVGFTLVGAGLVLGWTVGWLLPAF